MFGLIASKLPNFCWKPEAIIDFRTYPNLSTKVLADMLTIDEILLGCSNPKVDRLETEVYG